MLYYDTHSHLNDPIYQKTNQLESAIKALYENQVFTNCVGFDYHSSLLAVQLAKKHPKVMRACVGIHPNNVINYANNLNQVLQQLENLIIKNRKYIVAMGEIGLDLHYEPSQLAIQQTFLEAQINLAQAYGLPIMFHIRDAFLQIQSFVSKHSDYPKLVHCFNTDQKEADFYLSHNCLLSIPGIVTFSKANGLQTAVQNISLLHLVSETDAPYLTPMPLRGKTNFPHYVKHTVAFISQLKQLPTSIVQNSLFDNAQAFFQPDKFFAI